MAVAASHCNRTEIVQMLLLAGERIERPHQFHCECHECSNRFEFDSLRHAQSRLNAFRGLASEAYISLASRDPILTAFELGRELRILSEKEKYFKVSKRSLTLTTQPHRKIGFFQIFFRILNMFAIVSNLIIVMQKI